MAKDGEDWLITNDELENFWPKLFKMHKLYCSSFKGLMVLSLYETCLQGIMLVIKSNPGYRIQNGGQLERGWKVAFERMNWWHYMLHSPIASIIQGDYYIFLKGPALREKWIEHIEREDFTQLYTTEPLSIFGRLWTWKESHTNNVATIFADCAFGLLLLI